jgi:hypothetical protein
MSTAVAGLVGVIVGGALTGLVQFLLARLKDDRDAKVSARLFMHELVGIESRLARESVVSASLKPHYERAAGVWSEQRVPLTADALEVTLAQLTKDL